MNTPRHPATLWPAFALVGLLTATLLCASCSALLPENVAADQNVPRTQVRTVAGASLATEAGLSDGVWLEVPRSGAAGSVGGYLSEVDGQRARLILLLPGASTYYAGGMVAKVRDYHDQFAAKLRNTGLRTWTLAVHECGTPYGQEDLTDVLSAPAGARLHWASNECMSSAIRRAQHWPSWRANAGRSRPSSRWTV